MSKTNLLRPDRSRMSKTNRDVQNLEAIHGAVPEVNGVLLGSELWCTSRAWSTRRHSGGSRGVAARSDHVSRDASAGRASARARRSISVHGAPPGSLV